MELFKSRTRVAYTNAVGDKVYPVIVDIKRGIKSTEEIQFMSSDINTGILSVAFIQGNDNYNVSGAEVVCSVMRPDASTLELPCDIVRDNVVEVPLGINGTSQDGVYSFDFKVFKGGNKVVGTPIMNYSVSLSISNDMVVEEDDRLPVLTVLMTQITALKNETNEVISTANTAIQNANKATDDTKLAISNAQSATQEAEDVIARVNDAIASGTQDLEVKEARDGEASLKARLDRDIEKAKQVYVNVEGSNISTDSSSGYLKDVEILGNTIQDASNLADIRSVGDKVEGQELYEIPVLSCGKNLIPSNSEFIVGNLMKGNKDKARGHLNKSIKVKKNTDYFITVPSGYLTVVSAVGEDNISILDLSSAYLGNHRFNTRDYDLISFQIKNGTNTEIDFTHLNNQLFQLEEGTVATPYEPYQEDKITILSPTPLEKVGDVADRIICKDGVWGVEKNIKNILLDGSYVTNYIANSISFGNSGVACGGGFKIHDMSPQNNVVTDTFINDRFRAVSSITEWNDSLATIPCITGNSLPGVSIKTTIQATGGDTVEHFKSWMQSNPTMIKYQTTNPQFIPLPHDQQVKLRTFANKTNILFLTEIEGTIKAQVPKSLGATVNTHTTQISNLNKELDRVKKLEESTVSTVTTESDFTTVEATSNGYFEDVKLEGKTLVNLWGNKSSDFQYSGQTSFNPITQCIEYTSTTNRFSNCFTKNPNQYKTNTKYTIIVNVFENTFTSTTGILKVNSDSGGGSDLGVSRETINIQGGFLGVKVFTITTLSDLSNSNIAIRTYIDNVNAEVGAKLKFKMIILEGDHTQNPPSGYIEGLKSVGEGVDEISVESVGNIQTLSDYVVGYIADATGILNSGNIDFMSYNTFIKVDANTSYWFKYGVEKVYCYREDKSYIGVIGTSNVFLNSFTTPLDCAYVKYRYNKTLGNVPKLNYIVGGKYQSDKKRLLFYNEETQTWEKPVLREWDSIEKHSDGKYYYHQRSGEVVLNGNEFWELRPQSDSQDVIAFNGSGLTTSSNVLGVVCDKFPTIEAFGEGANFENVFIATSTRMQIRVLKSKLPTQDVQGFKQWLQANNVTVVYQLAQEKVYECTNIDLITYANETNYIVESGAIVPRTTLKVHNNISNVVKILQEKVSLLENKFIEGLKQVLAGDMYSLAELLYPEDFTEETSENGIMLIPLE